MNNPRAIPSLIALLVCMTSATVVSAQYVHTRVENAEVVYVEGNAIVLRSTDGVVRLFEIPDSSKFTIDGRDVTVQDLKPGMKLTAEIGTANAPRLVDTVEVTEVGAVWKTVGSNLIIKTPGGENKMYRVPSGSRITLNGIEKTVDQLHEGDKITATVVRMFPPLELSKAAPLVRKAPPMPARVGPLLIDEAGKPAETSTAWATPALIILLVVLLLAAAVTLVASRRKQKA